MTTQILIPARLSATRLPRKPLALIHNKPMIVHVLERALEADIGPVTIACCSVEIKDVVESAGGHAILTNPDHPSGSDRIMEALEQLPPLKDDDIIINLQGDLPTLAPEYICAAGALLNDHPHYDVSTLAAPIVEISEIQNPNVVKVAIAQDTFSSLHGQGLYFSRNPVPANATAFYHHIGIYAYRFRALKAFVQAPPTLLEQTEKLEQLRALQLGLKIGVQIVKTVPLGVDTPEDLMKAEVLLQKEDCVV